MINFGDEKIRERIGITLLTLILIISGVILVKSDKSVPNLKENISNQKTTVLSGVETAQKVENNTKVSTKININKASIEELDTLPGIGEKTAQKIIDYRKSHGGFKTLEELMEVSGIGEAKYGAVKSLITL